MRCAWLLLVVVPLSAQVTTEEDAVAEALVVEGVPLTDDRLETRGGGPTFEQEVVIIVNQERWANGQLPPLKHVDLLDASAGSHSENMAIRDFFAHCDPDTGTTVGTRMQTAGYQWNAAGENIAIGYSSPSAVMAAWMGSTGHRNNILSTNFEEIGVGYYFQGTDQSNVRQVSQSCVVTGTYDKAYFRYWTQNFGRRGGVYPLVIEREAYETDTMTVALYVYGPGNAVEMRFRNDNGAWSDWMPFSNDTTWDLNPINGHREVDVEVRTATMTTYTASDTIVLMQACITQDQLDASVDAWPSGTVLDMILAVNNLCDL